MSDASVVYITRRSLTMTAPGMVVYHTAANHGYGMRTGCGITIWSNDQREWTLAPVRRDIAECFARPCSICDSWYRVLRPAPLHVDSDAPGVMVVVAESRP